MGTALIHSFRQQQTGSIVRCQRTLLPVVLAWVAVFALLLGHLGPRAALSAAGGAQSQSQSQQLPPDERGGDTLHEQDPAKVRRQGAVASLPDALLPGQTPHDASFWQQLGLQMVPAAPSAASWSDMDDTLPWRSAPGHRQQRGQAPPLA